MAGFLFILVVICVILFAYYVGQSSAKKTPDEVEVEQRLEDEFIYDPDTGAKMTLEQAESGHFIRHDNSLGIKTDKEIEENYDEDNQEVEYIVRYFREKGIGEHEDEEIDDRVKNSEMAKEFNRFAVVWLWSYKPNTFIGIVNVENYGSEYQLFIVSDNAEIAKFKTIYEDIAVEAIEIHQTLIRFARQLKYADFRKVIALL